MAFKKYRYTYNSLLADVAEFNRENGLTDATGKFVVSAAYGRNGVEFQMPGSSAIYQVTGLTGTPREALQSWQARLDYAMQKFVKRTNPRRSSRRCRRNPWSARPGENDIPTVIIRRPKPQSRRNPARGRAKIYVGHVPGKLRGELFRSKVTPTEASHGHRYGYVVGPFRTTAAARLMCNYGAHGTVADAERSVRRGRSW